MKPNTASGTVLVGTVGLALLAGAEELPALARTADRLQRSFPPTADQPGFFEQVTEAALAAGISPDDVTTLSPGVPVLVGPAPAPPAAPAPDDAVTDETAAAGEAADAAGEAGAARAGETGAADPATAAPPVDPGAVAIQAVTIDVVGNHTQLVDLLDSLESMDRSLLLASASVTRSEDELSLSLAGATFVAPPLGEPPAVP